MSIEALKEQARRHEQKEQWQKALDLYVQAMSRLDGADQLDISLFNRAGDLCTRLKQDQLAVEYYEKSVKAYVDAELPNNAIAICKKVLRNLPDRHEIFLRMGQIRAMQGFVPDARASFLEYAGRMEAMGEIDEALRALIEFAALVPADFEIRLSLAHQLKRNERGEEAVEQFVMAHQELTRRGMTGEAGEVAGQIFEIDPDAVIPGPNVVIEEPPLVAEFEVDGGAVELEATAIFGDDDATESNVDAESEVEAATDSEVVADEGDFGELPDLGEVDLEDLAETVELDDEPALEEAVEEEVEDDHEVLPTFGFQDDDDDEEAAGDEADVGSEDQDDVALPTFGFDPGADIEDAAEGEDAELDIDIDLDLEDDSDPDLDADAEVAASAEQGSGTAREQGHGGLAAIGDIDGAISAVEKLIQNHPDDVSLRETMVQYAFKLFDPAVLATAYMGLGRALEKDGKLERARDVYGQAALANPDNEKATAAVARMAQVSPGDEGSDESESFVDLGAMILGEPEEKTTRFVVAYEEPSGDEDADFAKMLSQFKEKVAQNLDTDDVAAHHDLGTAYLEMGLIDEAVGEFQQALRASPGHLPTFEMLGRAFLEKGEPEATVRSLTRALDTQFEVEDELIGIYYYLGQAHEELDEREKALDFYDRVFALDINFGDVTERLRALRD